MLMNCYNESCNKEFDYSERGSAYCSPLCKSNSVRLEEIKKEKTGFDTKEVSRAYKIFQEVLEGKREGLKLQPAVIGSNVRSNTEDLLKEFMTPLEAQVK